MGNILSALWDGAKDSVQSPLKVVKDVGKGDFKGAWSDLKHIPGNQERANKDIFQSAGIKGWVGDHPGESVGSAIAAIMGGAALMGGGAAGAGGAGGAAGSASGAAAGGTAGGTAGTIGGSTAGQAAGGQGFFGSLGSYFNPSTAGGQWGSLWDSAMAPSDTALGNLADAEAGGAVNANLGTGSQALGKVGGEMSWGQKGENMSRMLKSIQSNLPQQQQLSQAQARASGFHYDSKQYQNPLLAKSYSDLYYNPHF